VRWALLEAQAQDVTRRVPGGILWVAEAISGDGTSIWTGDGDLVALLHELPVGMGQARAQQKPIGQPVCSDTGRVRGRR
jgi:hypothetical protein